jgi:hypothetical protein
MKTDNIARSGDSVIELKGVEIILTLKELYLILGGEDIGDWHVDPKTKARFRINVRMEKESSNL